MPIYVEGHRSRGVAEALRDNAHGNTRLQRKGATGVTEVVEPAGLIRVRSQAPLPPEEVASSNGDLQSALTGGQIGHRRDPLARCVSLKLISSDESPEVSMRSKARPPTPPKIASSNRVRGDPVHGAA